MATSLKTSSSLADPAERRHLLRRLAFSASPASEQSIQRLTVYTAVTALVEAARKAPHPAAPNFTRGVWLNSALRYPDTSSKEYQALRRAQVEANQRDIESLRQWWLREMIAGASPLRENLVLFFQGTFGSSTGSVDMPHALHGLNALLRRSCLGTIPVMLEHLVADPAMMIQIGMDEYRKDQLSLRPPNYRPAKLILDNWTVGAGEYSETDLTSLGRALMGWVLVAPRGHEPKKALDPKAFRSARRTGLVPVLQREHIDAGPKTILGTTRAFDARSAIRFLARHPATARRFSRRLIQHFGVEDPHRQLEQRLVDVYRTTDGSIEALLRSIVLSEEFWAPESRWSLIKSPVQLAVGVCRQLEISEPPLAEIGAWLVATGQKLFDTPNFGDGGWSGQEAWVTPPDRLAIRYQLGLVLGGRVPGLGINVTKALPESGAEPAKRIAAKGLQGAPLSEVLARLDPAPGVDLSAVERHLTGVRQDTWISEAVGKIVATPQYQLA